MINIGMDENLKKAINAHKKEFGVEPITTGARYFEKIDLVEEIWGAIKKGEPYKEEEVPPGVKI